MVAVQALYAAADYGHLGWLDEPLIAAGVSRRCGSTATAPAGEPCPICGDQPAAADAQHTDTRKDSDLR